MKKINIKPLNGRIVIKAERSKEKSKGGIILPDNLGNLVEGHVAAVSPYQYVKDGIFVDPTVSVGDKVVFLTEIGVEITIDDEKYLIMNETEILAIL